MSNGNSTSGKPPIYGLAPYRPVDVGPQFEEFTAGPQYIPQPTAVGAGSAPPRGTGTITYGDRTVTPEPVSTQPLPWWFNEVQAKIDAKAEAERAAEREKNARYWAKEEFKSRTGNLVPRSMAEAIKASEEMDRIEGQLGIQYDIAAGVPPEQAWAKWGSKAMKGQNLPRFGGMRSQVGEPRVFNQNGVTYVQNPVSGAVSVLPNVPNFNEATTITTPTGKTATIVGNRVIQEATPKPPPRIVTAELPNGEKMQMTAEAAIPIFEGKIAEYEEAIKTAKGNRLKSAQTELEGYKRALESIKKQITSTKTVDIPMQPDSAGGGVPVVKRWRLENGKMIPKQ